MRKDATLIVDGQTIKHSTRRIAYQIYEANFNHKTLYVVGIAKSGVLYAKSIIAVLEEISDLKIHFPKGVSSSAKFEGCRCRLRDKEVFVETSRFQDMSICAPVTQKSLVTMDASSSRRITHHVNLLTVTWKRTSLT